MSETQSSGPLETSGVSIVFSIKYFVSALACRRVQSTHFELFFRVVNHYYSKASSATFILFFEWSYF